MATGAPTWCREARKAARVPGLVRGVGGVDTSQSHRGAAQGAEDGCPRERRPEGRSQGTHRGAGGGVLGVGQKAQHPQRTEDSASSPRGLAAWYHPSQAPFLCTTRPPLGGARGMRYYFPGSRCAPASGSLASLVRCCHGCLPKGQVPRASPWRGGGRGEQSAGITM